MDPFKLDFCFLNSVINPDTSKVAYKGNEDKFVRVAFDLFKTKDSSCEDLWKIQADDDGQEYLVRTYNVDEVVEASDWSVAIDKTASNLTVSYRGVPIRRLAAAEYDVNNEREALILRDLVKEKLATNKDFLIKFAKDLPHEKIRVLAEMGAIDPEELAIGFGTEIDDTKEYHGPGFKKDPDIKDLFSALEYIGKIADRGLQDNNPNVESLKQELRSIKGHVDRMFYSQKPTLKYQGE